MLVFKPVRELDSVAMNVLNKRYFWPGETSWEDITRRVIENISKEDGFNREILYQLILNRYFIPNSPTLVNAGKSGGGLSACFVVPFEDSIEDIYLTKLAFALIAKKGGGCGTTLSKIRPKGSPVAGSTHGYAGGPVDFYDTICHDMEVITQAGFREMAMMGTMSVYHPDILYFINAKRQEGKMRTTNISVVVDDEFMKKVENDEEYETHFNGKVYAKYKARDIFNMIVDGVWRNGEPGILFYERMNNSPYKYTGQEILATNPCLDKDTILLDGDRLTKISLGGKTFISWKTGNKEVIRLNTNAGYSIILTPEHKVMLPDGTFEEAKNLLGKEIAWIVGDRKSNSLDRKYVLYGFLFGDGFVTGRKKGISVKINPQKEPEVAKLLEEFGFNRETSGAFYINRNRLPFDTSVFESRVFDRKLPDEILFGDSNVCRSFLVGLFEANGSVNIFGQISLKSTNKDLLSKVQILLASFGIKSWLVENKPRLVKWLSGEYVSRTSYNLQISPREGYKFKEKIGFLSERKNRRIKNRGADYRGKLVVTSIENLGIREVWDFSNLKHWEVANGVSVHNCGEQPLPPWGVCNLGSLDLSKFVNNQGYFDFQLFEVAVRLGVRFLDDVIDANTYPMPQIHEWTMKNRPIGLGIMGLADYFLLRDIEYGSKESLEEIELIMSFMKNVAEDESIILGEERGIPEECKKLPIPRRNITVLSIAPTGTISILAGCSSGIEPVFSEVILRTDKTGTYEIRHPFADSPYFKCAVKTYPETKEVTVEEHILVQNAVQKFVDSGVSKTINFPNEATRKDVYNAFMMAWKLPYIKGLTIYRSGSRQQEVLRPVKKREDLFYKTCPLCGAPMIKFDGCEKCSECDYSVCTVG